MAEQRTTFCRICENQCGLRVTVDDNRITHIEPDTDHVVSKGYACIKGLTFENVRANPDRLTRPLKRRGEQFEPVGWEQALGEIGDKLRELRARYGDDSVALYFGNPISFSAMVPLWIAGLVRGLNTSKFFNTGSLDCNNKFAVSEQMYGAGMALTFPDVDHTRFLMVIGGNPAISKMSFIHLPDPVKRLRGIVERGGRVVHLNPRLTETAKAVGEQVFIRPDTDEIYKFAFLHEVLRRDAVDHARVAAHMSGFDALWPVVEHWTPERQAAVTGVAADTLRELVDAWQAADGAALYASTGINQGRNGTLAFWALEVINAISGNFDRRGGTLMGQGIIDYGKLMAKNPSPTRYSRIGNTPSLLDALPTPLLADEILTPGEGQVKALLVISGNPLLTATHSEKMARALSQLELLVSVEIVRNETAEFAHYVLPGSHFAERPDIPFTFFSFSGLTPVPWFQYTDALVKPPGEARDELWIISQLARVAGAPLYGSRLLQGLVNLGGQVGRLPWLGPRLTRLPERLLGLCCRIGGMGSLRRLRRHPHGLLREPIGGDSALGKRIHTGDGKLQLAPPAFVELARTRLPGIYDAELAAPAQLKLITKRERFSHNSWAHNDPAYIKGQRQTNYLYMHPQDAAARQLRDGQPVQVSAAVGRVEVPLRLCPDMMPGSVALPHGWGHQRSGQSVARTTTGANANILAADGPDAIEPISGMAQFNGIPVEVAAVVPSY